VVTTPAVLGELNVYDWTVFAGAHAARHTCRSARSAPRSERAYQEAFPLTGCPIAWSVPLPGFTV
jgi:hypothetical protein